MEKIGRIKSATVDNLEVLANLAVLLWLEHSEKNLFHEFSELEVRLCDNKRNHTNRTAVAGGNLVTAAFCYRK